ncbi:DEAD/DEAH box helicase [Nitriliruptoria bacterium AS10]|nr:DEAD/DEAH box helicase [Salsipaludibacter albus]
MGRCAGCGAWGTVEEAGTGSDPSDDDTDGPGDAPDGTTTSSGAGPLGPLDGLSLRPWQVDAFAAWATAGCRGVVEAITGAGKTRLAMAAVRVVVDRGGVALVLVPTLELLAQWVDELRAHAPTARVGRLGGGNADDFGAHDVLVATPASASDVPVVPAEGQLGLLVADEAHRYGAPTWSRALRDDYAMRLALTATYERADDGVVDVLGPYFGPVVSDYGYARAAADGVIAPFAIALVGTRLDDHEQATWDTADRAARRARRVLLSEHGLPRHPRDTLRAAVEVMGEADSGARRRDDPVVAVARDWLVQLRARRDAAAQAAGKLTVAAAVAPTLHERKTLVFCDTVDQAEQVATVMRAAGPLAETIHGGLSSERRRIRMAQFRNGNLPVVVAPRVLDEGVDVPDADVAIVLAAFRSRRQMVQRLGRVLRRTPDDRVARLLIVHAVGTHEDPSKGAHEEFLDEVLPVAVRVDEVDADEPGAVESWMALPLDASSP